MDGLRAALKGQYRAGLAMLRQCMERCPDEVWIAGEHPRTFWRIAYHAVFYTHLYIQVDEDAFQPWELSRPDARKLWHEDDKQTPEEPPYSKQQLLEYVDLVSGGVDRWVDALNLEAPTTGFWWYSIPKLDHQLMSVRHLQGHVGQLSERLYAAGVDLDWITLR